MSDFRMVATFAAGLCRQRADIACAGNLRRDPMALYCGRGGWIHTRSTTGSAGAAR